MELKLDEKVYITYHNGIVDNTPEKDENEIQREGVFIDRINVYDFEYKGDEKQTKEAYLKHLVQKGAEKKNDSPSEIKDRLNVELDMVISKGLTDYFLVVYKLVQNAKRFANASIETTSMTLGMNSLVCYCLGLHHCDPIKYGLSYERFFYTWFSPLLIGL